MMFAFCSFSFPFFIFFLFVEKNAKQKKPTLTRIVGDTVQESCLFIVVKFDLTKSSYQIIYVSMLRI